MPKDDMKFFCIALALACACLMFGSPLQAQSCDRQARAGLAKSGALNERRPIARTCRKETASRLRLRSVLRSSAVMIFDPKSKSVLFEKNSNRVMPIASITKLMTALIVLEAKQDMKEMLTVSNADVDRLKYSSSRLRVGTRLSRAAMLHLALMSSENRAASALGRHYPGGEAGFVVAMNRKARSLGMTSTRFVEPTGLSSGNVSTPSDLARLVIAAHRQRLIRHYSTDPEHTIKQGRLTTPYRNSNRLIASARWKIGVQKTGYTSEAGRCMVLHAVVKGRAVVMVFLDAHGKFARAIDANKIRYWLASGNPTMEKRRSK